MILVVEDNPIHRESLAAALRLKGLEVRTCASAVDALILLNYHLPAALVLDLIMPAMSGETMLNKAQGVTGFDKVKVIVTTGYVGHTAQLPPGTEILHKPFEVEELIALLPDQLKQMVKDHESHTG